MSNVTPEPESWPGHAPAQIALRRHRYAFAVAIGLAFLGSILGRGWSVCGLVLVALGGVSLIYSGLQAFLARAHMFGVTSRMSNDTVFVKTRRSPTEAYVVGGVLVIVGSLLVGASVSMLAHAF